MSPFIVIIKNTSEIFLLLAVLLHHTSYRYRPRVDSAELKKTMNNALTVKIMNLKFETVKRNKKKRFDHIRK